MGRLLALIASLIAAGLIAWFNERPPQPAPADAPATAFSAERAMADVRAMAAVPHPMGTPANHRVRNRLLARMAALGLSPQVRRDDAVNARQVAGETYAAGGSVENLVGVLPGRDPALPAVVLMAHYDSVPGSPGAADDAAGVSAALETLRAIQAQGRPVRDVMVLITDGEESGLLGANAFFRRDPLARRVGLLLNMEARGGGGRVQMFETSPGNGGLVDLLRRTARRPASSSLSVFVYQKMPNDTDMTESNAVGVPGLNFGFIGQQFDYHSPTSTPANLDRGTLQDLGDQVLSTARAAAFAADLPAGAPDAVYSQAFGDVILAYPASAGWLVLAAAAGLIALGVVRARRIEAFPWLDVARGAGATLFAVLGAAAVLHFARKATGAEVGFFEQRFLLAQVSRWESAVFLLALGMLVWSACEMARGRRNIVLVPLAAGLVSSAFGGFDAVGLGLGIAAAIVGALAYGRGVSRPAAWTGVLALGLATAAAVQVAAPATAYIFAWPLLLAGIGGAATAMAARRGPSGYAVLGLLATIGLAWIAGLAHVLFLGLDLPELLAVPVWVAAILIWPLAQPDEGAPPSRLVGPLLLGVGFLVMIGVRLNTPWDARHPQATTVVYHLDQDTGRAWRVSTLAQTEWTDRVLAADGEKPAAWTHWAFRRSGQAAAARPLPLPAPQLTSARAPDGTVVVTLTPPPGVRMIGLQLRPDTPTTLTGMQSLPLDLRLTPGRWAKLTWEAAPAGLTVRLRPAGPGALDVRYVLSLDGWPSGAAPLPPRPPTEMAFDISDSVRATGSRRVAW